MPVPSPHIVYLHGFASGPGSAKATFFAEKLRERGLSVEVPDLAEGDFTHLTITRQLMVIDRVVTAAAFRGEPVALIGSSLGGYLASLYAVDRPTVDRLVLLAPAFGFHALWQAELGEERLRLWRDTGYLPIYHYGEKRHLPLAYDLMSDAAQYVPFPNFIQPALIFHGLNDSLVPVEQSRHFARLSPNVRLAELQSGHELTDVLDDIWLEAKGFLAGEPFVSDL